MKTMIAIAVLATAVALPVGAAAKPSQDEKRAAKQECKTERGKTEATREAFRAKYHSFARCMRRTAAEEETENETAHKNAAKECKAEREADAAAFLEKYGSNKNGKNAYGKCVSSKAKAKTKEMDAEDAEDAAEFKNAARECAAERGEIGSEAFAEKYGTNANKKNAFGKCVSSKSRETDA